MGRWKNRDYIHYTEKRVSQHVEAIKQLFNKMEAIGMNTIDAIPVAITSAKSGIGRFGMLC